MERVKKALQFQDFVPPKYKAHLADRRSDKTDIVILIIPSHGKKVNHFIAARVIGRL